ncbi:PREDICTED: disintegrin and metalloproteinase domain-containing protein 21-like [Thamnophis sirtalis]|uniref:Disintegrin and metalloproteinase domain-containing protein 21-like n=1 Tax=Thamnophis sirtalis TaxID=35019 RepID=A0A6I9YVG2_9SAUR|nr:PREDICTED: disintegrin and metalloproteinase domain-containing protein 21-like [Thamnophis sirtalis]
MTRAGRPLGCWFFLPLVVFTLSTIHCSSLLPPAYSSYEVIIPRQLAARGGKAKKDELSYLIKAAGRDYIIRLNPAKHLLAKNLPVFTYDSKGERMESHPYMPVECYRQGHVEGVVDSLAVLRTCLGLTGLLKIGARIYGIEPLLNSSAFQHLLYLSAESQPIFSPYMAGVVGRTKRQANDPRPRQTRRLYSYLQSEVVNKYIELYIVVNKNVFDKEGGSISRVQTTVLDVVNIADATFRILNTHIILVGLEIWTKKNLIDMPADLTEILHNFNKWRQTGMKNGTAYDTAFLFLHRPYKNAFGHSYQSGICEPDFAAGLQVYRKELALFARGFSHELASHIGMEHDDTYCVCGKHTSCLMRTYYASVNLFSNCSILNFIDLSEQGLLRCLQNVPEIPSRFEHCGNGVLDVGEQCDCGEPHACLHDPCCTSECRLRGNAICGSGKCCRKCAYIPKGEICRAKANECDLPEYCDGKSAECPKDYYLQDGTPCSKYSSYCYKKRCWNHDSLCRRIFRGESRSAGESCYLGLNILGTPYGNCGIDHTGKKYVKCHPAHSMCGKVQCVNVKKVPNLQDLLVHVNIVRGTKCWTVSHPAETNHPHIGSVPNGIVCDPYKVCIDRECLPKTTLNLTCEPRKTCRGRGVCNNLHKCHCNSGWAPPNCKYWGAGGSIDGGCPVIAWGNSLAKYILGTMIPFCMLIIAAVLVIFPKLGELLGPFLRWWKNQTPR